VITVSVFLYLELFAGLMLAAWLLIRHPTIAPSSLSSALASMLAAMLLIDLFPSAISHLLTSPGRLPPLLCLSILPPFALFLTTAWVIRALMAQAGNPGGGEPVPRSRMDASAPRH
jgi:hypothetical protein